jgi:hypothetical protein
MNRCFPLVLELPLRSSPKPHKCVMLKKVPSYLLPIWFRDGTGKISHFFKKPMETLSQPLALKEPVLGTKTFANSTSQDGPP